jgi:hypothetical protein
MTCYRVTFFTDLLSSDGHKFKCPQATIEVRHAKSPDRAVRAAEYRFARLQHLRDWKLHADYFEVEVDGKIACYRQVLGTPETARKT